MARRVFTVERGVTSLDEHTMLLAISICEQVRSENHAVMMQQNPASKKACMFADLSAGAEQCRQRLENALDAAKMKHQGKPAEHTK
jgi:hypothetical protein